MFRLIMAFQENFNLSSNDIKFNDLKTLTFRLYITVLDFGVTGDVRVSQTHKISFSFHIFYVLFTYFVYFSGFLDPRHSKAMYL